MVAAGAAVLLAACSSGSTASTSQGAASGANLSGLSSNVNQGAAVPNFSTYAAGYGGKLPSTANLSGKKIMILPGDSALAACTEIAQADAAIATAVGMKPTIFANQGTTAEYNNAIEDAIHGGFAAIDAGCDFDPTLVAPAIAQARKAGIVVAVYGATPQEATASKVTYNTDDPYALDAKYAAEQAVVQHGGKPFKAIAITSNAAPATAIMESSLKSELASICPACSSVKTSAVSRDPKPSVLFQNSNPSSSSRMARTSFGANLALSLRWLVSIQRVPSASIRKPPPPKASGWYRSLS